MQVQTTNIAGLLLFVPTPFRDERGFFSRTFDAATRGPPGLDPDAFVQDSQSRSAAGWCVGCTGAAAAGEAKLVRVRATARSTTSSSTRGAGSPTFGQAAAFRLDDETLHTLYIPRGFLHGFQALTETADTCYRIDAAHDPTRGRRGGVRRPGARHRVAAAAVDGERPRPRGGLVGRGPRAAGPRPRLTARATRPRRSSPEPPRTRARWWWGCSAPPRWC